MDSRRVGIVTSRAGLRAKLAEAATGVNLSPGCEWTLPEALGLPASDVQALIVDVVELFRRYPRAPSPLAPRPPAVVVVGYYSEPESERILAATSAGIFVHPMARLNSETLGETLGSHTPSRLLQLQLGRLCAERARELLQTRWEDAALTPAQTQVLELVRRGFSNDGIAGRLSISVQTVKNHVSHIMVALGANSRYELIVRRAAGQQCHDCSLVSCALPRGLARKIR